MSKPSNETTPAPKKEVKAPKATKITGLWTKEAISWPGGFGTTNRILADKDVKLSLPSMVGWVLIQWKGKLAATNGLIIVAIDPENDANTSVEGS